MLRLALTACLATLAVTASAHADVIVSGTGEPAFTNSTTNTQWFEWSNTGAYKIEFGYAIDAVQTKLEGPYTVAQKGTMWANWAGVATLQEGKTYSLCALGRWQDATGGMWFPDFFNSCNAPGAKRGSTTIDRTKPVITLDAPAFAREVGVGVTIGYEDNLAYPFGVAFAGVDSEQLAVLPGCAPANPAARVTTFACTVTLPATDGAHSVCAVVPDAAVPDNPNSSDQRGTATQANLSERKCREVVLDRAAPSATVTVPDALRAGNAALFVAEATDATSGIASATWNWGDGTTSTGFDASHVYAAPGTYRLRFAVTDAAGHRTEVTKDLIVQGVSIQPTPTPRRRLPRPPRARATRRTRKSRPRRFRLSPCA